MTCTIKAVDCFDIRFPTSRFLDGSDAMNPDPDYSLAYVVITTDADDGVAGHGYTFTIGRGTEICVAAVRALAPMLIGQPVDAIVGDLGSFWRRLVGDSQLRWLGPEKGVMHLATAAVVNAVWDLHAKREGKPLWQVLADLSPAEVVDLVDFRYIADVLSPGRARELLEMRLSTRAGRLERLRGHGIPAYVTSPGWLGYSDEKLVALTHEAVDAGWRHIKYKVGTNIDQNRRRLGLAREALGPHRTLMTDANQVWGVTDAIEHIRAIAEFDPFWVEEPTSPDDVLGYRAIADAVTPIRLATGEHVHNRVMFKQLLQIGAMGFCQLDACRLGGINEALAVMLLAAEFDVPVCPHAGGVGLSESVQHLSAFDYLAVSSAPSQVLVEYVDHLHDPFIDPAIVKDGHYVLPVAPGASAELHLHARAEHQWPGGAVWR